MNFVVFAIFLKLFRSEFNSSIRISWPWSHVHLLFHYGFEFLESFKDFWFLFQKVHPCHSWKIIYKEKKIVTTTKSALFDWFAHIYMYEVEWLRALEVDSFGNSSGIASQVNIIRIIGRVDWLKAILSSSIFWIAIRDQQSWDDQIVVPNPRWVL